MMAPCVENGWLPGLRRGWETFCRSTATDATSRLVPFAARRLCPLRPRPTARSTLRSAGPIAAPGSWAGESRGRLVVFGKREAASRHFFFGPDEAGGRVGVFGRGRVGQARPAPDRRLR